LDQALKEQVDRYCYFKNCYCSCRGNRGKKSKEWSIRLLAELPYRSLVLDRTRICSIYVRTYLLDKNCELAVNYLDNPAKNTLTASFTWSTSSTSSTLRLPSPSTSSTLSDVVPLSTLTLPCSGSRRLWLPMLRGSPSHAHHVTDSSTAASYARGLAIAQSPCRGLVVVDSPRSEARHHALALSRTRHRGFASLGASTSCTCRRRLCLHRPRSRRPCRT
jgi:hypothetical protein